MKVALGYLFQNDRPWLDLHLPVITATRWYDGLVAVDGGATDGSRQVMAAAGAHVTERPFDFRFASQGNALIDLAESLGYDALVRVDPDELLWPEHLTQLRDLLEAGAFDAIWLARHNFVRDRQHIDPAAYPDYQLRAWRLHRGYRYRPNREVDSLVDTPGARVGRRDDLVIYHYGSTTPWPKRWAHWANFDRRRKGMEPTVIDPADAPPENYPAGVPFTGPQPLDPQAIGQHAPFGIGETMTQLDWYQRIPLPDGTVTPGVQDSPAMLTRLTEMGLPEDMTGLRVLDVGTRDGYYAVMCEQRGAEVLAVDIREWPTLRGVLDAFDSKLTFQQRDVYDLSVDKDGQFDIILLLGVIYHLRYPLLALDRLRQMTKDGGWLFVESHMIDEAAYEGDVTSAKFPMQVNFKGALQVLPKAPIHSDMVYVTSVSALTRLLEHAGYRVRDQRGRGRGVFAARVVDPETDGLSRYSKGVLTVWVRDGAYGPNDRGVLNSVQEEYFTDRLDYSSLHRVVDVGAHIGCFTSLMKHYNPQMSIHAVEADAGNYGVLCQNVKGMDAVTTHHAAIWYGGGEPHIGVRPTHSGGHQVFDAAHVDEQRARGYRVEPVSATRTVAQVLDDAGWDTADLLKLDCETCERSVLLHEDASALRRFRYIVGEYHTPQAEFDATLGKVLTQKGFAILSNAQHPDGTRGTFLAERDATPPVGDTDSYQDGDLELTVRNGAYRLADEGVVREVQRAYYPDTVPYADLKRVVDAGAHIGAFTRYVCGRSDGVQVRAVEPEPANFALLKRNTEGLDGVRVYNVALWDADEQPYLAVHPRNSGGHRVVGPASAETLRASGEWQVSPVDETATLQAIIEDWDSVDLLKLDVEGAEVPLLADVTALERVQWIVGERHMEADAFDKQVLQPLADHFEVVAHDPHPDANATELGTFLLKRKPPAPPRKKTARRSKS